MSDYNYHKDEPGDLFEFWPSSRRWLQFCLGIPSKDRRLVLQLRHEKVTIKTITPVWPTAVWIKHE